MVMSGISNLIDVAVQRYDRLFASYDRVIVYCSGGKDSTCIIETGLISAKKNNRHLDVVFFDQEIIFTDTVDYMKRLRERKGINLTWYCLPVTEHLGAALNGKERKWYPFDPKFRKLWIRNPPDFAITKVDWCNNQDESHGDMNDHCNLEAKHFIPRSTCQVIGRRSAESPARRAVCNKGWLLPIQRRTKRHFAVASVIHDWNNYQVWEAIKQNNWDWNRQYYNQYRAGISHSNIRCAPSIGKEASRSAADIQIIEPDLWRRIQSRIPEADYMARYGKSCLFGRGLTNNTPITAKTIMQQIRNLPKDDQETAMKNIRYIIRRFGASDLANIEMKDLIRIAIMGDSEGRKRLRAMMKYKIKSIKKGRYLPHITLSGNINIEGGQFQKSMYPK